MFIRLPFASTPLALAFIRRLGLFPGQRVVFPRRTGMLARLAYAFTKWAPVFPGLTLAFTLRTFVFTPLAFAFTPRAVALSRVAIALSVLAVAVDPGGSRSGGWWRLCWGCWRLR